jgi:hypothetical protein
MIQVDDKVHELLKKKAKEKGMTLKGYMKYLSEKDK